MYSCTLPSTSALDGGRWSTPRPCRFTPGKVSVPIVLEAGWAPGPVWTGAENLSPTGIRSPDLPARSESLYRLHQPGSMFIIITYINDRPSENGRQQTTSCYKFITVFFCVMSHRKRINGSVYCH
jgi:hypothetical protein